MKWKILAIFAVFCLQLGFTAYTAIDREIETMVVVNEVTGTDTFVNAPDILSDAEFVISIPNRRMTVHPAEDGLVSRKKVLRLPLLVVNNSPQIVVLQKPFESTTIRYSKAIPTVSKSEIYHPTAGVHRQPGKKSIVSKSFAVLKKPYDLLKALGSRIN